MAIKCTRRKKSLRRRKNKQFVTVQPVKPTDYRIYRWWKRIKSPSGKKTPRKWKSLQHNGPLFSPDYKPLPKKIKFYYDGKPMRLEKKAEEIAGLYAKMLEDKYTKKKKFNENFFQDWRKAMTDKERATIVDFKKCNFEEINRFYKEEAEKAKQAKNKDKIKKEKEELAARYGFCVVDGKVQKVANFRTEPPGLFRGRGDHPKMGRLKKRIEPEDVTINIGKDDPVPKPPRGHKWMEVVHNNTVTWLASWKDSTSKSIKYIMLHPSSKLKGQNDIEKYEMARKLKLHLRDIRKQYMKDLRSPAEDTRQKAVVVYFIDRLALRSGYEKDLETGADTVGCCSLRVEHITMSKTFQGEKHVIHLDFPGKDNIRYHRSVPVDPLVYKNLQDFLKYKNPRSLIFDTLNSIILNKYLNKLMENLTAKVFRTCHASTELENQLKKTTKESMSLEEKLKIYNMANRSVAILCNHQRAVPKTYAKSIKAIENKIKRKIREIKQIENEIERLKRSGERDDAKYFVSRSRKITLLRKQIEKLQLQATVKKQNKDVALGTSKLNYLDPRISVSWCKKWQVPIEKIYNKTQRERFLWAIETTNDDFTF